MVVVVFLLLVVLAVAAWAAFAFFRGSKEVADETSDLTTGHQFPAEKGDAPTLLEDDLSFANRETDTPPSEHPSRD
jgi:hypothetical protein